MHKSNYTVSLLLALSLLAATPVPRATAQMAQAAQPPPMAASVPVARASSKSFAKARKAADNITQSNLRRDLTFIASDELGGRDTPSPGLDKAAEYIAARLQKLKIKPAGDNGTYFQRMDMSRTRLDEAATVATFNNQTLKHGTDFMAANGRGNASGKLVFVGNGWMVKSRDINPYAGVDVRDKIMVIVGGSRPAGITRDDLKGTAGVDWADPYSYAKQNGARGIILIPRAANFAQVWEGRRRANARGSISVVKFEQQNPSNLPTIIPSEATLVKLFEGEGAQGQAVLESVRSNTNAASFDMNQSKDVRFNLQNADEALKTQNVVAVLEGSDKQLKNEYVAIGAHYDHVGTNPNVEGDKIWNGADDDGSGTVGVLAVAEAFAKVRPRRSILFVWHAGEEKGLLGSRYFVENPTVPLANIVAQFNIDMIGRSRADSDTDPKNKELTDANEIYVIGSRMMSDALGTLSEQVNRDYLGIKLNYKYDDVNDPNRFFYRSDHYNYAVKGIPIIFYFSGVHADYHQPSDSIEKIDFGKMERITRTIFMTASEIANLDARPRVDRPLPASAIR